MKQFSKAKNYRVERKKNKIVVLLADQDDEAFFQEIIPLKSWTYTPMMRFVLEDKEQRTFFAERYYFRGCIDNWIFIGGPDSLERLMKKFLKHLGEESFYELIG